jgi:hypothetical protein
LEAITAGLNPLAISHAARTLFFISYLVTFLPEKKGHNPFRPKLGLTDFSDLIFGHALTIAAVFLTVTLPTIPLEIYEWYGR